MAEEYPLSFREARPDAAARLAALTQNRHPLYLILDGLTDPRNIGSLFRLADAARLAGIYLVNMPNWSDSDRLQRAARATVDYVPYQWIAGQEDFWPADRPLWALEWTNRSRPYNQWPGGLPAGLVLGNEQRGVSAYWLQRCRGSLHIPMMGMNTSMNVHVAAGIAVYRMLEKANVLETSQTISEE